MMLALTIWQPHAQLCVIDGCDKPSREGRKHCSMHAERIRKYGDPHRTRRYDATSPVERVLGRVEVTDAGCWEFTGSRQKYGHGLVRVGSKRDGTARVEKAHRVIYEACVGPIPDGLVLDHLCSNPPCVNPDHLDPCTRSENTRRERDRRTQCRRGHPWAQENITTFSDGRRTCSICWAEARRRNR